MSRRTALPALLALLAAPALHGAGSELPTGFGPLSLGAPWSDVEAVGGVTELTRPTSDWERLVHACGYRSAMLDVDRGRLLVTAQDSRITKLSYVTSIQEGSNVMDVAKLVMRSYGQPRQATLRDEFGTITLDPTQASYVVLEYDAAVKARFSISAAPLWEYRISVEDGAARRLENLTLRCAREREKALDAAEKARTS